MDVFNRRRRLDRGGSRGKGDGFTGQENRRPKAYGSAADARGLNRTSSLGAPSTTSGASGSPKSVLPSTAPVTQKGGGGYGLRAGNGAAYNEAKSLLYRNSSLARNSREPPPEQPGSARSRAAAQPAKTSSRDRTSSAGALGKKDKRAASSSKAAQQAQALPIQAIWDNVYLWCGSWCGQAPRDVLTEDVDELHSKLDRLQMHCEKLSQDNAFIKEQNDRLKENMRLLQSTSAARGSGGPAPAPIARGSGIARPSPHDSQDDLAIPKGRGPVRKGDLVGNAMAWILGGPKPR